MIIGLVMATAAEDQRRMLKRFSELNGYRRSIAR
jgi:hypothetical protein